jgi:hypothetical protein
MHSYIRTYTRTNTHSCKHIAVALLWCRGGREICTPPYFATKRRTDQLTRFSYRICATDADRLRECLHTDYELLELGVYLKHLGEKVEDFRGVDHTVWKKTVRKLRRKAEKEAKNKPAGAGSNPGAGAGSSGAS